MTKTLKTQYVINVQRRAIVEVTTTPYTDTRSRVVGWRSCFGDPFPVAPIIDNARLFDTDSAAASALWRHVHKELDLLEERARELTRIGDALCEEFGLKD